MHINATQLYNANCKCANYYYDDISVYVLNAMQHKNQTKIPKNKNFNSHTIAVVVKFKTHWRYTIL